MLPQSRAKARARRTSSSLPELAPRDAELFERLRELRRELASERGVPPYVIFHDKTLVEMCSLLPGSLQEFGALNGVGERKQEKYGPDFLRVIATHQDRENGDSHQFPRNQ